MRLTKLLPALIPLVLVVAVTRPGHAQPQPEPPSETGQAQPAAPCGAPADASSAEAWYWLGKEQGNAGNQRCAMEAYAHSWELRPSYDSAGNAGMNADVLGEHALVCKFLSYSLANIPASLDEQKKQVAGERMRQALEESLRHVGRARAETKPGAQILVDGKPAGLAPLNPPALCLPPGSHTIEARLEGFQSAKATIDVKIGPPLAVELPLQPAVAEPPQPKPVPDEEPSGDPGLVLGIAGLVVGGAGVFTGIALLLASAGKADTVDEISAEIAADPTAPQPNPCGDGALVVPRCEELADASDDKATFRNTGIAALVVGGAVLVGSAVYLLVPRADNADQALRLHPLVDHQHAGLLLSGIF